MCLKSHSQRDLHAYDYKRQEAAKAAIDLADDVTAAATYCDDVASETVSPAATAPGTAAATGGCRLQVRLPMPLAATAPPLRCCGNKRHTRTTATLVDGESGRQN